MTDRTTKTTDGTAVHFASGSHRLAGTLFLPDGPPRAGVVLNSAAGVPQTYYRHFARWLAEARGMACLTYDYRDFGKSGASRGSPATMADWALRDQPAARAEMRRLFPGVPLWVIGHSLGAMLLPIQEDVAGIDRVIGVASGLVRHSDHPWPYQALARLFWFGHAPVVVRMLGYLPGRISGFGVDMPGAAYWQWRRWCTTRDSYLTEAGKTLPRVDWGRSGAPVDMIAFADDPVIPPHCVWRLADLFEQDKGAPVRRHLLAPAELGVHKIGHLGAFARRNAAVWPHLLDPGGPG